MKQKVFTRVRIADVGLASMRLMLLTGFITCIFFCTVADEGFQILEGEMGYL